MDGHLLRFKKNLKIAFLDLETYNLCLSFLMNRPWQCGILVVENNKITETHDIIVNWLNECPHLKIKPEVAMMNHYSEERVRREGVKPEEAFKRVWEVLKRVDLIIMHNGLKFDLYFLKDWAVEMGEDWKFLMPKIIDTKAIAQGIKLKIPFNALTDNFLEYQYRMANDHTRGIKTRLPILAKEFDIPFDETKLHDAIYDLTINKLVWDRLVMQIDI